MINIDFDNKTYVCPYCGHAQAYYYSYTFDNIGKYDHCNLLEQIPDDYQASALVILTLKCNNSNCGKVCVTSRHRITGDRQFDIIPECTYRYYPEYIPLQIRQDYEEACGIISKSPKAAATLLRRCLQGMIRDFWGIKEKNLNAEITKLKENIPSTQWAAIDGLRKIGNIGAHMEKDVNLIIDVDEVEASKLLKLVELLLDKWYIARSEEEKLFDEISNIAEDKTAKRKINNEK